MSMSMEEEGSGGFFGSVEVKPIEGYIALSDGGQSMRRQNSIEAEISSLKESNSQMVQQLIYLNESHSQLIQQNTNFVDQIAALKGKIGDLQEQVNNLNLLMLNALNRQPIYPFEQYRAKKMVIQKPSIKIEDQVDNGRSRSYESRVQFKRTHVPKKDQMEQVRMIRLGQKRIEEAAQESKVDVRTIYRWLQKYQ